MSGFMKTRLKDWYRTQISKGDDIKIKTIVSPFILPLLVYPAFIAVLALFFARFHGLKVDLEFRKIKVKKGFCG